MTPLVTLVIPHMMMSDDVYSLTKKILETVLLKTIYSAFAAEKTRKELRDYDYIYPSVIIFVCIITLNY